MVIIFLSAYYGIRYFFLFKMHEICFLFFILTYKNIKKLLIQTKYIFLRNQIQNKIQSQTQKRKKEVSVKIKH